MKTGTAPNSFLRQNGVLLLLILAGGILRLLAIHADPFLHPWDERFHALVAKNMMDDPWVPMLKKHPLNVSGYDAFGWCCNRIWIHKQPLFLWQMAGSMKLFGTSLWALRLPSALMGTAMIPVLYRIAVLVTGRKAVGLWAAALLAFSFFHLEMIGGIMGMDHNDVAHGFYVLLSLWCWTEWRRSRHWGWALATGVFAGGAVLNKWLTGLLVYLGWGVSALWEGIQKKPGRKREWGWFSASLFVCTVVFMPWQIYISNRFPVLAAHEYAFNRRHITEALSGRGGGADYYVYFTHHILGIWGYVLPLAGGLMLVAYRKRFFTNPGTAASLLLNALFGVLFFSFIVQTKVETYLFFTAPLLMLFAAVAWVALLDRLKSRPAVFVLSALLLYDALHPAHIAGYLSEKNTERQARIYNAKIYKSLSRILPARVHTVMNMNSFEDIDVLFYNNNITAAHHWTVSPADLARLQKSRVPVAFFIPHGGSYHLSPEAVSYPFGYQIQIPLKPF